MVISCRRAILGSDLIYLFIIKSRRADKASQEDVNRNLLRHNLKDSVYSKSFREMSAVGKEITAFDTCTTRIHNNTQPEVGHKCGLKHSDKYTNK
jgi:hypothetical protein